MSSPPHEASASSGEQGEVWTIGHSTYELPVFVEILQAHGIESVVDVRRFPGSRRHPQFARDALCASLPRNGVAYHWVEELGGRRRPDMADSEGSGWRHPSFRAYAQYLRSEEFAAGFHTLLHASKACRTAIMCSELLWWRCHRRLIADAMLFCGWRVTHIMGPAQTTSHRHGPPLRVGLAGLSYSLDAPQAGAHCC